MTATCGDPKRLCRCGTAHVDNNTRANGRCNIQLAIVGPDDDLFLTVSPALARDIINSLEAGLSQIKETR